MNFILISRAAILITNSLKQELPLKAIVIVHLGNLKFTMRPILLKRTLQSLTHGYSLVSVSIRIQVYSNLASATTILR